MLQLPAKLVQNNAHARGAEGLRWLEELPQLLARYAARWNLTLEAPFEDLSFNYVVRAVRGDGTRAVLKLAPPSDPEAITELAALAAFEGHGMVRPLELDAPGGAVLLERLEPGVPLHTLQDDRKEMAIAAAIMRVLWREPPPGHTFPTVARWGRGFARHRAEHGGTPGPLPARIFARGEQLHAELDASSPRPVLLHGDLHQGNILSARRRPWLAIDPKGVVGDPAYETGPLLLNLWDSLYPVTDPAGILEQRVRWLADDLGLDRERVRLWGVARLVLSAVWSAENGGTDWQRAIELAEILDAQPL